MSEHKNTYEYVGIVKEIGKLQTFPSGFAKKTLILTEDPDAKYVKCAAFDFIKGKNYDSTKDLDGYREGQRVVVTFETEAHESKKVAGSWFSGNKGIDIRLDGSQGTVELVKETNGGAAAVETPDDLPF